MIQIFCTKHNPIQIWKSETSITPDSSHNNTFLPLLLNSVIVYRHYRRTTRGKYLIYSPIDIFSWLQPCLYGCFRFGSVYFVTKMPAAVGLAETK